MKPEEKVCGDCGKKIRKRKRGWASRHGRGWLYCCRTTVVAGRLIAADYHAPEGEKQRHFPVVP